MCAAGEHSEVKDQGSDAALGILFRDAMARYDVSIGFVEGMLCAVQGVGGECAGGEHALCAGTTRGSTGSKQRVGKQRVKASAEGSRCPRTPIHYSSGVISLRHRIPVPAPPGAPCPDHPPLAGHDHHVPQRGLAGLQQTAQRPSKLLV